MHDAPVNPQVTAEQVWDQGLLPAEPLSGEGETDALEPETRSVTLTFGKSGYKSFFAAMRAHDFKPSQILAIGNAVKEHVRMDRLPHGTEVDLIWQGEELQLIRVRKNHTDHVEVTPTAEGYVAAAITRPTEVSEVAFAGMLRSNLWESAKSAGMDPRLIQDLSDIFAWQVDFSREISAGDQWRLVVQRHSVDGETVRWGPILIAEVENNGVIYSAVRFDRPSLSETYYTPDGRSLRSMFLKSPMRFARITSKFSRFRLHPVLKVNRPHLGVDYAAPVGSPIRAVGAGVILNASYRGSSGNYVRIRHNATYQTSYKHLQRFADGIVPGTQVEQGQVIGYVGATGLVTGPHLHFEFYENGQFVDPLGRRFPTADPVPLPLLPDFEKSNEASRAKLPRWPELPISLRPPRLARN
jgi:murein DD-endopeptidase MepM/ murein hydrolase activator NlpD